MKTDNGKDTVTTEGEDNRHRANKAANTLAIAIVRSENRLATTAKDWGTAIFCAVYTDGLNLDTLIGESKIAAGWKTLTLSDAGRKAKQRLEVYFSNARLVAERYSGLTDDERAAIIGGTVSIHYLADRMRKADRDEKAAKAAKAAAEKAATSGEADEPKPIGDMTLSELMEAVLNRYQLADDAEKSEAHPAVELFIDAFNADITAAAEALSEAA